MDDLSSSVPLHPTVAKIERVPLREVWRHEAHDLTTWLEENIDVLNDVLDLELTNVEREQAAGLVQRRPCRRGRDGRHESSSPDASHASPTEAQVGV